MLIAAGVDPNGRRSILGVSVSLSEAEIHWRTFLQSLVSRGSSGVRLIVSDDWTRLARGSVPDSYLLEGIFHLFILGCGLISLKMNCGGLQKLGTYLLRLGVNNPAYMDNDAQPLRNVVAQCSTIGAISKGQFQPPSLTAIPKLSSKGPVNPALDRTVRPKIESALYPNQDGWQQ